MSAGALLLLATQIAAAPVATSIEPSTVVPYRPARLAIHGEGFEKGCRVLLGVPGRLVPVRSEVVEADEIHVQLTAGLSPEPTARQIVVDCGRGRRSEMLVLTVAEEMPGPEEDQDPQPGTLDEPETETAPAGGEPPQIHTLDPPIVTAGEPLTLTVMGANFSDGATVEVFANANAGTSRQPEYRSVPFSAEFASDTVLLVDFDRGFAASPRQRSIAVVNPDGGRSPPLYLEITRSLP
jgi:hypothetical protein